MKTMNEIEKIAKESGMSVRKLRTADYNYYYSAKMLDIVSNLKYALQYEKFAFSDTTIGELLNTVHTGSSFNGKGIVAQLEDVVQWIKGYRDLLRPVIEEIVDHHRNIKNKKKHGIKYE